jgi:tRNA-uridine 2-sulfurtransferase
MSTKSVVAVAMSGGVDSSVAAALLVEQGYTVIGMMLRLWSEQNAERANRCCTPDSMAQARRVASLLSIPFYVLDARQIFYDQVVIPFINDYAHNLTPNPCIYCNRSIRWDFLLNQALSAGADFLSTGHYVRITQQPGQPIKLLRGTDTTKEQSYVLHVLTQNQLQHAMFPLGGYTKVEVRQLAHNFNLPVAERPESQDLCFVGEDGDYRQFLLRHAPGTLIPGEIIDRQGTILGYHQGLANFTIGQRKGLRLAYPTPLYVLEKEFSHNRLIVGPKNQSNKLALHAEKVNWIAAKPTDSTQSATVKIRYRAQDVPCIISGTSDTSFDLKFENPLTDITPGQAAVLYNGDVCLGGGIIAELKKA